MWVKNLYTEKRIPKSVCVDSWHANIYSCQEGSFAFRPGRQGSMLVKSMQICLETLLTQIGAMDSDLMPSPQVAGLSEV